MASVDPFVKMISSREPDPMNSATCVRTASKSAVALSAMKWAALWIFP